jgi:tRNA (Thr-GGU) A37 N-methylase
VPGANPELFPIGIVESPLRDRDSAPKQGDEGAPDRLRVSNLEALDGTPVIDLKPVLSGDVEER